MTVCSMILCIYDGLEIGMIVDELLCNNVVKEWIINTHEAVCMNGVLEQY